VALPFLDTNVLLHHLLQDHPDHSPRATAYVGRIEQGAIRVRIADSVVFEAVFMLSRLYRRSKLEIRDALLPIIDLPNVVLPGKGRFHEVFDVYVELNLSIVDAYHAVLMKRLGLHEILSFDRGLDRVAGIRRVEP
jgi:predicted nucleic acid-binding protein